MGSARASIFPFLQISGSGFAEKLRTRTILDLNLVAHYAPYSKDNFDV